VLVYIEDGHFLASCDFHSRPFVSKGVFIYCDSCSKIKKRTLTILTKRRENYELFESLGNVARQNRTFG